MQGQSCRETGIAVLMWHSKDDGQHSLNSGQCLVCSTSPPKKILDSTS